MNKKDFLDKLDWEGGPYELYNYGLDPEDIEDKELRELWKKFTDLMNPASFIADELMRMLEEQEKIN